MGKQITEPQWMIGDVIIGYEPYGFVLEGKCYDIKPMVHEGDWIIYHLVQLDLDGNERDKSKDVNTRTCPEHFIARVYRDGQLIFHNEEYEQLVASVVKSKKEHRW
jgi:hypothetical protein